MTERERVHELRRAINLADACGRRNIEAWKGYGGGHAWIMLYGGLPSRCRVLRDGVIEDYPHHIANAQIVSVDVRAKLLRGNNGRREWWKLIGRSGKVIMERSGRIGRLQTVYRRRPRRQAPRPVLLREFGNENKNPWFR